MIRYSNPPFVKAVCHPDAISLNTERFKRYRERYRKGYSERYRAVKEIRRAVLQDGGGADLPALLWAALKTYEGCPFKTSKGLEFTYRIKGNEMFVDRKDKSITRASINMSLEKAMELHGVVSGPKKLGTFGASYLYPVFLRMRIIKKSEESR